MFTNSVIRRFKDGQSILDGDSYIIHKNGTLEISVAQPLNGGKYTCMASNSLGNKENHVHLEVKGKKLTKRAVAGEKNRVNA